MEIEGGPEVGLVERRLIEFEEAPNQKRVVVEEAVDARLAVAVAVEEVARLGAHRVEEEASCLGGGFGVVVAAKRARGDGEGGDREAVPIGEDFVVEERTRTLVAGSQQVLPDSVEAEADRLGVGPEAVRDGGERVVLAEVAVGVVEHVGTRALPCRLVQEIALGVRPPHLAHEHRVLGPDDRLDLGLGPDVEGALLALPRGVQGVGVLGGVEGAGRGAEVAEDVVEGRLGRLAEVGGAGGLDRLGAGEHVERLVIEHLLEVRKEPHPVRAVAVEPAPEVVPDAAAADRAERGDGHRAEVVLARLAPAAEEEQGVVRRREFRGRPEAPELGVEALAEGGGRRRDVRLAERVARLGCRERADVPSQFRGGAPDGLGVLAPEGADPLGEVQHPEAAAPRLAREVGAHPERLARVRREERRQRPPAAPGRREHGGHVDAVHVRPLLAVHLDADERIV